MTSGLFWHYQRLNHRISQLLYLTRDGAIPDQPMNIFAKSAFPGTRFSYHQKKARIGRFHPRSVLGMNWEPVERALKIG